MEHETALPEDGDGGITRDGMLLFLCLAKYAGGVDDERDFGGLERRSKCLF